MERYEMAGVRRGMQKNGQGVGGLGGGVEVLIVKE